MLRDVSGAVTLKILSAIVFTGLAASPALARQNPTPPPSGIVVHLFGPNSVSSQFLPSNSATAPSAETGNGAKNESAAAQAAPEPTFGGILHQMFVTGDPNRKTPGFAPGRGGSF